MNYQNDLTYSMAKYMLSIFGLSDYQIYNTTGITKDEFKTELNVKIQYDNDKIEKYPIYSAVTTFNNSKLHVVGCSIADEDGAYYAALFKLDEFDTYAIKVNLTDLAELPIFIVSKSKGHWTNLSMYEKIIACAGIEKLNDAGIIWKSDPIGDFYGSLIELVEM